MKDEVSAVVSAAIGAIGSGEAEIIHRGVRSVVYKVCVDGLWYCVKILKGKNASGESRLQGMAAGFDLRLRPCQEDMGRPAIAPLVYCGCIGAPIEGFQAHSFCELTRWVPGVSLDSLIKEWRKAPDSAPALVRGDAIRMVRLLAEDIACIGCTGDGRRFFHCDVKPSNIIVSPLPSPHAAGWNSSQGGPEALTLIDYDSAATVDEDGSALFSSVTFRYGAPEAIRRRGDAYGSVHSSPDVYSLGVVAHELLAGHSPYPDGLLIRPSRSTWISYLEQTHSIPCAPCLPEDIVHWLRGCLEKDPRRRVSAEEALGGIAALEREYWGCSEPVVFSGIGEEALETL